MCIFSTVIGETFAQDFNVCVCVMSYKYLLHVKVIEILLGYEMSRAYV